MTNKMDIPLLYDMQIDGHRYLEPVPPKAPITIIHGRDDATVPIDHSDTLTQVSQIRVEL